jgi:hypothetical protein
MDRIITAQDYSKDEGADGTARGRIKKMQELHRNRGAVVNIEWAVEGAPVVAQINQGAWIAKCECGGAEFVLPTEPIFFCWGCCNRKNGSKLRPVTFPKNHREIEDEVLKREVDDQRGITDKDRAYNARPLVVFADENGEHPASRSWVPGETVATLRKQNKLVEQARKERA